MNTRTDPPTIPAVPDLIPHHELKVLVDIRYAIGDNGRRMQPDLVEYVRAIKAKADRVESLEAILQEWLNFSIDVRTSDLLGHEWLVALKARTAEAINGGRDDGHR